mmetsp:Transcript_4117/g.15030  ORF Transcript_4117/g.15030 Transcript_4117/m.15030 type:complete len:361 (+) Transcript_4117:43-1125(+)
MKALNEMSSSTVSLTVDFARNVQELGRGGDILVAATGKVEHNLGAIGQTRAKLPQVRQSVGSFESRDDTFQARDVHEGIEGFLVGDGVVFSAAEILQKGVLGANAWVVKTGGNRVRLDDLTFVVLNEVGERPVQHTRRTEGQRRRVLLARADAFASRFDANNADGFFVNKVVEQTHGVGTATDARDKDVRQAAPLFHSLRSSFLTNDGVEVAHHHRVRVRTRDRAQNVVRVLDVRHPITNSLARRVLQRRRTRTHRSHGGAEQTHTEHVELLAFHIRGAHVNDALEAETRTHRRRRHTVLTGTSFSDNTLLTHALRQQRLSNRVVNLVRARVVQVFALQVHVRTLPVRILELLRQSFRKV